ncbi:hypothetical protein GC169_06810 [bacterium]|nr:hypothetical protein [bacterium]
MLKLERAARSSAALWSRGPAIAPLTLSVGAGGRLAIIVSDAALTRALARLCDGRDKPTSGRVTLAGEPLHRLSKRAQRLKTLSRRTVRRSGDGRAKDEGDRIGRVLAQTGAELVILDDPLAGHDDASRGKARERIAQALARGGPAVVLVTTHPDDALVLAAGEGGQIAVIEDGRLLQVGPAVDLLRRPETLAAARLLANPGLNVIEVEATGDRFRLTDGSTLEPPAAVRQAGPGRYSIAFRAEHITRRRTSEAALRFAVRVEDTTATGAKRVARLGFAGAHWSMIVDGDDPAPGLVINAFVEPDAILVFDAEGRRLPA